MPHLPANEHNFSPQLLLLLTYPCVGALRSFSGSSPSPYKLPVGHLILLQTIQHCQQLRYMYGQTDSHQSKGVFSLKLTPLSVKSSPTYALFPLLPHTHANPLSVSVSHSLPLLCSSSPTTLVQPTPTFPHTCS